MEIDLKSLYSSDSGDFKTEITRILTFLQDRYGFDLWMLTRIQEENWIVVHAQDKGYGVAANDIFRWADSFCSRMVQGDGPQISPDSNEVPCYQSAEIGNQVSIRSYIGVPIHLPNGDIFGTLCAIDPEPKDSSICDELPLINMVGTFIDRLIATEIKASIAERNVAIAKLAAETDPLTGLKNRLAWDGSLAAEEARVQNLATPTAIMILDLDGLKEINDTKGHKEGDVLILNFSKILSATVNGRGTVFRLGGDEFGVLLSDTHMSTARLILMEIRNVLDKTRIQASAGIALRDPKHDLINTWHRADKEMYRDKDRIRIKKAA